jgi:phage tail-like protein
MATGDYKPDPYRGYNFKVEIDGISRNGFREVSGLDTTSDPILYREGDDKVYTEQKLPGLVKYGAITLKYGITDDHSLWDWRKKTIDGKTERKNGSVILMSTDGQEKVRWNFVNAWPSKYVAPTFNAQGNEVAIETFEIQNEGFVRA